MQKASTLLTAAVVLAVVLMTGATRANAAGVEWSVFGALIDSADLDESFGIGFRASIPFRENWEADITLQWFENFENLFEDVDDPTVVELGLLPIDFGVVWTQREDGGFNVGAGLSYAFVGTGGLSINDRDIPDIGEADDEFGGYIKFGWRARNGFIVDVLYRPLDVSIESIQIPPGLIVINPPDRIDLDMDSYQINLGYRF